MEALVERAKKAIHFSVADSRLSASEFLTMCTEVANLVNERPLGLLPSEDLPISVLTPNCLLLGRPLAEQPGALVESKNCRD